MSKVIGLRGVVLETPQLDACTRFYRDVWELPPAGSLEGNQRYFRGRGDEPWLLGLVGGSQRRLLCLRLGAASPADVDALHLSLQDAGVPVLAAPGTLDGPGAYYGFAFKDPDGRSVEVSAYAAPAAAAATTPCSSLRASHLVLNSPQARAMAEFYVRHLGFEISDWYENDAIIFLRCNDDHHCLGIGQGGNTALNHLAFLVDDAAAVQRASAGAIQRGAEPVWGPGRHGPGGNVFSYFKDPAGFVVEYTAELIQIPAGTPWQAKQWQRTPANANTWGTGGPTPLALRLMNGE
jgi:catechol 2,3-dioxygenase-like lactoylglutathione lyase family enzyme